MAERDWPLDKETGERTPSQSDEAVEDPGETAGGADPVTGEPGRPQSSNADIPAAD